MDLEFSLATTHGLSRYVQQMAVALGLPDHGYYVQLETPANAYLALDTHIPGYPTHDAALVWDEVHGWAAAIEGADLVVVGYLGDDVLPTPTVVAECVRRFVTGTDPIRTTPTAFRDADAQDDLSARLAHYARGARPNWPLASSA